VIDWALWLRTLAVAAAVAAALSLAFGALRRAAPRGVALGGALGVGVGLFVGALLLGVELNWPPKEVSDQLLLVVLPAAVVTELLAALCRRWWLAWLLRLPVVLGAARVLLQGHFYLDDPTDPDSRAWGPGRTTLYLGGLAVALLLVWGALDGLARKGRGTSVCLALAVVCLGAGFVVMLSGYASGGILGIPLAGALLGAAAAGLVFALPARQAGAVAVGVVGLFGLLLAGHFFASLTATHAVLLFLAPLLCWLPEVPPVRRLWPVLRGALRVGAVAALVGPVLAGAKKQADEPARTPVFEGEDLSDELKKWDQEHQLK
jgi:hypothetical protein